MSGRVNKAVNAPGWASAQMNRTVSSTSTSMYWINKADRFVFRVVLSEL